MIFVEHLLVPHFRKVLPTLIVYAKSRAIGQENASPIMTFSRKSYPRKAIIFFLIGDFPGVFVGPNIGVAPCTLQEGFDAEFYHMHDVGSSSRTEDDLGNQIRT